MTYPITGSGNLISPASPSQIYIAYRSVQFSSTPGNGVEEYSLLKLRQKSVTITQINPLMYKGTRPRNLHTSLTLLLPSLSPYHIHIADDAARTSIGVETLN
jgi:hypothetical protein